MTEGPGSTVVQIEGEALSLGSGELVELLDQNPSLRFALLQYVYAFVIQTAQTALANARGNRTHCLTRWLLMAQDRVGGAELRLTQQFLAMILGVRRASVNIALGHLESHGVIAMRRKSIVIKNRRGLEEAADKFYGEAERELARLSTRRHAS